MKKLLAFILCFAFCILAFSGCNVSVNSGFGTTYYYEQASLYTMGGAELTDHIEDVKISWVSGKVTVQYHDGDTVLITESSDDELTEDTSLYYRVNGETLMIQYAKSGVWTTINFEKELTVSLPSRFAEDGTTKLPYKLSFETVSADVDMIRMDVSKCEFETVSGKIYAELNGNMTLLGVQTVSGNVTIKADSVEYFDVESVSGNVYLSGNAIASGDAETVSGDIALSLPENTGYTLDFDSVSGNAYHSDAKYQKKGDRYTVGDGACRYNIESVSGNVTISYFQKQ